MFVYCFIALLSIVRGKQRCLCVLWSSKLHAIAVIAIVIVVDDESRDVVKQRVHDVTPAHHMVYDQRSQLLWYGAPTDQHSRLLSYTSRARAWQASRFSNRL